MQIINILSSPWAIILDRLLEIQAIYSTHLRGEKLDISAFIAQSGGPKSNPNEKRYDVTESGVAIVPMYGVMGKRMNLFTNISGGVSTELVSKDIREILKDPDIKGILLDIDSPGGTVDGTQDLADVIFAGRDVKPIVAYTSGMIASAAYWVASAAHKTYISSETCLVGSIGVVSTHIDYSEYEKKMGVKTTEIYAGKYKRIASQYKTLSKEGKKTIQDEVDYIYTVFVENVAKHKGKTTEEVLTNMADGRTFIGKQAVDAGLVDGIDSMNHVLNMLPVMQQQDDEAKRLKQFNNKLRGI